MRASLRRLLPALIFLVAFAVRLASVLRGGGLHFFGEYDDGVYYAAADALSFGRVPYRDFVLLHPPGSLLVLTPFAALGRLTSDGTGMAAARLFFMAIGGMSTALVTVIATRWGRWQGVVAGLMYAGWNSAVLTEQTTFLEALGSLALLVALVFLLRRDRPPSVRDEIVAGVALGLACSFKIWYVAPWAVVVAYQLASRRFASASRLVIAGAIPLAAVLAPFFALAPRRMWDMVVRDQVLRKQAVAPRDARFSVMLGIRHVLASSGSPLTAATVVAAILAVAAAIVCVRDRVARLVVVLLVGNAVVLYLGPSFYRHYAALVAGPLILVLVIGLGRLLEHNKLRSWRIAAGALATALAASLTIHSAATPIGRRFPVVRFSAAAPPGCITSDDPAGLIQMNRLSQDFRDGCQVPVDVTGITYDSLRLLRPDGAIVQRSKNIAFQDYLQSYLTSGSAFVVLRRGEDAMPPRYRRALAGYPLIARADGLSLRAGTPASVDE